MQHPFHSNFLNPIFISRKNILTKELICERKREKIFQLSLQEKKPMK